MWEHTWGGMCVIMYLHPWVGAGGPQLSPGILWFCRKQEWGGGRLWAEPRMVTQVWLF